MQSPIQQVMAKPGLLLDTSPLTDKIQGHLSRVFLAMTGAMMLTALATWTVHASLVSPTLAFYLGLVASIGGAIAVASMRVRSTGRAGAARKARSKMSGVRHHVCRASRRRASSPSWPLQWERAS
jgi:hypothetical protein